MCWSSRSEQYLKSRFFPGVSLIAEFLCGDVIRQRPHFAEGLVEIRVLKRVDKLHDRHVSALLLVVPDLDDAEDHTTDDNRRPDDSRDTC